MRDRAILAVAAFAIVARLSAQVVLGFYERPEAFEEDIVAYNILSGRGYVLDLFGAPWYAYGRPVYTFLLLFAYLVAGPTAIAAGVAQALLGGALAATTHAIGGRLAGPGAALVAGLATALHPGLLVYSAKIHPLNLDALLAALGVLLLLVLRDRGGRLWAATGILAGIDALARPTLIPALAIGGLAALLLRGRRSRDVRLALSAAAIAAFIVAPWIARAQIAVGRPVLTSSTGYVLWIGHNPLATGGTLTADGRSMIDATPAMRDAVWGRPELEQDAIFRDAALAYIAEDPARAARQWAGNVAAFWSRGQQVGALYARGWADLYAAYYLALVALAGVGGVWLLARRRWYAVLLIAATFVTVSAVQAAFYVDGRHRWEVEPILIVLAGIGAAAIAARLRSAPPSRRIRRSADDEEHAVILTS